MSHHFFPIDGALYDTRAENWASSAPLRSIYNGGFDLADIDTGPKLCAALRAGAYVWPGGYPVAYKTRNSGALCPQCVVENLALCISAIRLNINDGWRITGASILSADDLLHDDDPDNFPGTRCDHCGDLIE